jgi:hypothetical protein
MLNIADQAAFRRYLCDRGVIPTPADASIVALSGGVSCEVQRVDTGDGRAIVVKQALPKLRVKEDWFSDTTRIVIEQAGLRFYERVVPDLVPRFEFYDADNALFAMEAAPPSAFMWKSLLMAGAIDFRIGRRVAEALARVHNAAATDAAVRETFASQKFYTELRIDPYLRFTATRHPDLAAAIEREIERLLGNRQTMVHGDYSPKNVLVAGERLFILDFEVCHIGDASFDLGFLVNHFVLKAIKNKPWAAAYLNLMRDAARRYLDLVRFTDAATLEYDTVRTFAFLFLARVDGKSPAEYITDDADKALIRSLTRRILGDGLKTFDEVGAFVGRELAAAIATAGTPSSP